jgi:high-affinity K+ transport system ATPase subunit B
MTFDLKSVLQVIVENPVLLVSIIGALVAGAVQILKRRWSWLDAQHPTVKQAAALLVAAAMSLLADAAAGNALDLGRAMAAALLVFAGATTVHSIKKAGDPR